MKAVKILNNSLILAADSGGNEVIAMGKGIGFHHNKGDVLDEDEIEKVFVLKDQVRISEYVRLIEENPVEYAEAVGEIIKRANAQLNGKLTDQLFITLLDHLTYAISRVKKGIRIQNRMLWEIKRFYPKEFAIAKKSIAYLNVRLKLELPEEEAANIAFHLVNAQTDTQEFEQTMHSVKVLKDIFNIIQYFYGIKIDETSLNAARFITHLQFFIQRILEDKMLDGPSNSILEKVAEEYPEAVACTEKIEEYIYQTLQQEITREEFLYLVIHISRLRIRSGKGQLH